MINRKKDIEEFKILHEQDRYKYKLAKHQYDIFLFVGEYTEQIMFSSGVVDIPNHAYAGIPFKKVIFNDDLQEIGDDSFGGSKVESLYLPDGLKRIGKNIFECAPIKEVRIPLHLMKDISVSTFPLINTYIFKDNEVIGKQVLSTSEKRNISQGYTKIEECFTRSFHIYIESKSFDFELLYSFNEITSLHISNKDTISSNPLYINRGTIVKRLYINKYNSNLISKNGTLFDTVNNKIICYEDRDEIIIDPVIDESIIYLPINQRHKRRKWIYTNYDVSKNTHYLKRPNGIIIHNKSQNVVFVPNVDELYLFNVSYFIDKILMNHNNMKKLVVCAEHNGDFDFKSFCRELNQYRCSRDFLHRFDPLVVILPKQYEKEFDKSYYANDFRQYINAGPNSKLIIVFDDIPEPVEYLE